MEFDATTATPADTGFDASTAQEDAVASIPPAPPAPHEAPDLKAAWQNAKSPLAKLALMMNWAEAKNPEMTAAAKFGAGQVANALPGAGGVMGQAAGLGAIDPQTMKSLALNGGGAALGQEAGTLGGPFAPVTVPAGGFIGGFLGNTADQLTQPGDKPFKWGEALGAGTAGLVPGASMVGAGRGAVARAALKFGGTNLAAKAIETKVDEGRWPDLGEALIAFGTGGISAPLAAIFGGGSRTAGIEAAKKLNSVRDETLRAAREAGYKIPSSLVNDSLPNTVLESAGGKAAVKQEMILENQATTNDLAKKPFAKWGLPQDEPLSREALDNVREKAGEAYERMTALFPDAGPMVYELKQARLEAKYQNNRFYQGNPPGDPQAHFLAEQAEQKAALIESQLEGAAKSAGKPAMVDELREARKVIAQTYQVENALNPATGDVSARVIGSSYKKGKPLTDGLDTIGRFYNAFKQVAGDAAATPSPGVGKTKAIGSLILGHLGSSGGPAGAAIGAALPFADKIPRAIAGSRAYQNSRFGAPFYGAPREDLREAIVRFATQSAGRKDPVLQFLNQSQAQP